MTLKWLAAALVIVAVAGDVSCSAFARGRWGRTDEGRAKGPTEIGPWVGGPWDGEWAEKLTYGRTPEGAPLYPVVDEWYPWGYTAPFVRVGRQCVANDVNLSPGGDYVRYQRVRPAYYCRP